MSTLIVNAGSSSHKLGLFSEGSEYLWRSNIDWSLNATGFPLSMETIERQVKQRLQLLVQSGQSLDDVEVVGHRIVHGGDLFHRAVILNKDTIASLDLLRRFAPLHNGPALDTLVALRRLLPNAKHAAAFDTAFHRTLPIESTTYALPIEWRSFGIHRFGFHGLSHHSIARKFPQGKLISCHLGSGCSIAVIRNGLCIDTTMGFSPLDGLVMATRSGSVDPGILLELLEQGISINELRIGLYQRSGLLGLSECSSDMRRLRVLSSEHNPKATLAIDVFQHHLLKAIGAGYAVLGGCDVLALTGGIGENDKELLCWLIDRLGPLNISNITVVPACEELEIFNQIRSLF